MILILKLKKNTVNTSIKRPSEYKFINHQIKPHKNANKNLKNVLFASALF